MAHMSRRIDSKAQSVGELLRRPVRLGVPIYQRDFAWTNEQIDTLWTDIRKALEAGRPEYFLGAVVLSYPGTNAARAEIVDGQQRLIALSVMFATITKLWRERGDNRGDDVFRDFLGSKDRRSGQLIPKLSLTGC